MTRNERHTDVEPASDGFSVTPHDSTDFTARSKALYIGGAGNVAVVSIRGTVLLFVGVQAGTILPVRARRVNSTGTTATSIIGLL